jgi:Mat/Ecp fimbriae major subunit
LTNLKIAMTDRRDIMLTKSIGRSLGLAGLAAVLGLAPHSALATNGTGTATAVILQAITVTQNQAMNFGDIFQTGGAGTVVMTSTGAISGTGFTFYGATAPGQFTAVGSAGAPAVISFSTGDTLTSGANTIAMGSYTTSVASPTTFPGTTGSGSLVFTVGATLTIGATQATGNYTGNYTVTVNY